MPGCCYDSRNLLKGKSQIAAPHREGQQSANQGKIEPRPLTEKAVVDRQIGGITRHHGQLTYQVFRMQLSDYRDSLPAGRFCHPHQKN